jgi:hypothetical protein
MLHPVSICLILSQMSKLDQIRGMAAATRARKNAKPNPFEDAARGRDPAPVKPPHKLLVGAKEALAVARGETKPAKVTIFKRGRPLAKDAAKALMKTRPWLLEGMSRASWYRRQKGTKK